MLRSCERPGCRQVAEVAFGFQAEPYVIWLDRADAEHPSRSAAGVLCRRHADAMVVPIGWSLDDRRQPVPRLFAPAEEAEANAEPPAVSEPVPKPKPKPAREKKPRAKRPRATEAAEEPASLFDLAPGEATVAELVEAPPPTRDETDADATPWRPVFDNHDDLGGLLAAKTPLLARAFRGEDAGPAKRKER